MDFFYCASDSYNSYDDVFDGVPSSFTAFRVFVCQILRSLSLIYVANGGVLGDL